MSALVLPATPQLWQPRNGQWWRRPRWRAPLEWFAGHLQYGSGTGHLKRNAAGHLAHTCTACDWCTLTNIRLTFSGVTGFGACYDPGFGASTYDFNQVLDGTFDTTYVAPLGPSQCYYEKITTVRYAYYDRFVPSCATFLGYTSYNNVRAIIDSGAIPTLTIIGGNQGGTPGTFFYGVVTLPSSCTGTTTVTNSYTGIVAGQSGYGGTCDVTPIP